MLPRNEERPALAGEALCTPLMAFPGQERAMDTVAEHHPDSTGARLDRATNSDPTPSAPWLITHHQAAGEVSISYNLPPEDPQNIKPKPGEGHDPERAMREASRRAATTIRRYVVANKCDRLWSLTYSNEFLPDSFDQAWKRDAERFRKKLYELMGGEPFPLVIVPERGGESDRIHLHLLTNRFIPKRIMEQAWEYKGFVDGRRITSWRTVENGQVVNLRTMGARERCRAAAGYLAGYVKKGFIEDHEFGGHRYSTSRGFTRPPRQVRTLTLGGARAWCALNIAGRISYEWSSANDPEWEGPPVWLRFYDDDPPERVGSEHQP